MNVNRIGQDPDALEEFYRVHVEDVQRFIARRVEDPYLAADLTSDVFLAAIDSCRTYDPGKAPPRAWLFGIARNVVSGERRRSVRAGLALERAGNRRSLAPDALERAAERLDAEREARDFIVRLSDLPEGNRAVMELVAVDGLTPAEAATALGISASAVRVRYHRARRNLLSLTACSKG